MESITVTPEELQKKADQVDDKAAEYYNEYVKLLSDVQTFTSTDYTGEDATAFYNEVSSFKDEFDRMKQLMNEYASYLREAAQNYLNAQENSRNAIPKHK